MKLLRKKIIIYTSGLIALLIASFVVGYLIETSKEKQLVLKAPRSEDIPAATSSGDYNVIPLGRNLESENFGFSLLKIS